MSKEISNTLFRMVNTRNPKKVKDTDKDIHFVIRPDSAKGDFDAHLVSNTENLTNWQKLLNYCPTFNTPAKKLTLLEVKEAISQPLYDFGVWVTRNSENANLEKLISEKQEISSTPSISPENLTKVWDNFIYQVITQEDFEIKEALMQLLKGNHVYHALQETNDPQLRQAVDEQNNMIFKCKVVFPNLFDVRENMVGLRTSKSRKIKNQTIVSEEAKKKYAYDQAQMRLKSSILLKSELEDYHKSFQKAYEKAYAKAKSDYDVANQPALDAYYLALENAKNAWCANRPAGEYNPDDPCHQPPSVPYPTLPPFEFEFLEDVSHKKLQKQLSDNALITLYFLLKDSTPAKRKLEINESNVDDLFEDIETFEDLFEIINKAIVKSEKVEPVQINVDEPSRRLVEINGVYMPVNLRASNNVNYRLSFIPVTSGGIGEGIGFEPTPFDGNGENPNNIIRNMVFNLMTIKLEIFDNSGDFEIINANYHAHFDTNTNWQANNYSILSSNTYQINFLDQWYLNRFGLNEYNSMLSISADIHFQNNKIGSFIIEQFQFQYITGGIYVFEGSMNLKNEDEVFVPVLNHLPNNQNSVKLLWTTPNQLDYFDLRYREVGQNIWQSVHAETNEKVLTGLVVNKIYEAQVRYIFDGYPLEIYNSPFSNLVTFSISESSGSIELINLVASDITQNSCKLTWDAVVNAASYDVNRIGAALINVTTNLANITGLTPNTGYTFIVSAKNAQGLIIASNSVQVKTATSSGSNNGNTPSQTAFVTSGFGIKQLGIADYDKVEQSTYCYIEGDVAHIENIMAREFREKTTRRLRQTTVEQSETFESEREQLTDTTSVDRFEMQSEVAKVIAQSRDVQANAFVNAQFGAFGAEVQTGVSGSYATHNSSEVSSRQAVTQAKEITERAMDRVVTKVKKERVEKILDEFEETNSHGFDNRKGDQHVVGVYRWVDKIIKNQIYTYGKRQMMEFMIPEPARLHWLAMKEASKNGAKQLVEPIDPRTAQDWQMPNFLNVSNETLAFWSSKFNVELPKKKEDIIWVGKEFSVSFRDINNPMSWDKNGNIEIPEDYVTKSFNVECGSIRRGGTGWGSHIEYTIGNRKGGIQAPNNINGDNTSFSQNGILEPFKNLIPIAISGITLYITSISANVQCQLTPEAKAHYQMECFNAIIKAYEKAKQDYDEQVKMAKDKAVQIKGINPGFYRQIENTVLRQNCIAYMVENDPNVKLTLGKSHVGKLNQSQNLSHANFGVDQSSDLDKYAAFVKFFEQAFEWDIMSYYFYPYYWGGRDQWASTYDFEDNDPLFRSFMQSGMARVIVTVRPGFEDAVSFYMKTGLIWNGGEVPTIGEDTYLSLAQEMMKPLGEKKGKPWRQRLPTPLTILQAESIGLVVEKALPCVGCDDRETFEDNLGNFCDEGSDYGFKPNQAQIGGANNTAKGSLTGNVKGLNEDDSLKVVLRNLQNQMVKIAYLYGDSEFNFTDLTIGEYDLNFDEEDVLIDNYHVVRGQVKQVVTISSENETIVSLTVKAIDRTKPLD